MLYKVFVALRTLKNNYPKDPFVLKLKKSLIVYFFVVVVVEGVDPHQNKTSP